jgi:hypothetical protein
VLEQRVVLEHEAHAPVARMQGCHVLAEKIDIAPVRLLQPGDDAQEVVLPQPEGPSKATSSPVSMFSDTPFSAGTPRSTCRSN